MQEATGQAGLIGIMLTIIGVIIVLLAGSIAYSKAFRVKNRIIDIIEKNNKFSSTAKSEIELALASIGYRTMPKARYRNHCSSDKFSGFILDSSQVPGYLYCVYKKTISDDSYYYKVVSFLYFDIPIIGSFVEIPVSGETKILYSKSTDEWKTVQ